MQVRKDYEIALRKTELEAKVNELDEKSLCQYRRNAE